MPSYQTSSMAARILSARTNASLTQTQVAANLGINRSAVAQWERVAGGTNPSIAHLSMIAELTGARFEWLATGQGARGRRRRQQASHETVEQPRTPFEEQCMLLARRIPQRKHALVAQLLFELGGGR